MALLLRHLTLDVSDDERTLPLVAACFIGVDVDSLKNFRIVRRSIDARKKSRVLKVYTVEFCCPGETVLVEKIASSRLEQLPEKSDIALHKVKNGHHALVVGMGPAGLFAAKRLAESGACGTLIVRGRPVEKRIKDVEAFLTSGQFTAVSNLHFGEGGAGTFSERKLTTRINHTQRLAVLKTLVDCGAFFVDLNGLMTVHLGWPDGRRGAGGHHVGDFTELLDALVLDLRRPSVHTENGDVGAVDRAAHVQTAGQGDAKLPWDLRCAVEVLVEVVHDGLHDA